MNTAHQLPGPLKEFEDDRANSSPCASSWAWNSDDEVFNGHFPGQMYVFVTVAPKNRGFLSTLVK